MYQIVYIHKRIAIKQIDKYEILLNIIIYKSETRRNEIRSKRELKPNVVSHLKERGYFYILHHNMHNVEFTLFTVSGFCTTIVLCRHEIGTNMHIVGQVCGIYGSGSTQHQKMNWSHGYKQLFRRTITPTHHNSDSPKHKPATICCCSRSFPPFYTGAVFSILVRWQWIL